MRFDKKESKEKTEEITKSVIEPTEEIEEIDEEVEVKPEIEGIVKSEAGLNLRMEANPTADIICILSNNDKVLIDPNFEDESFYFVRTGEDDSLEGYVMKSFIEKVG